MRVVPGRLSRIVRRFLRAPSFTTVAVLTLALGIGANAAIFSVIRGVLLKPLPFSEPDSLVAVWHTAPGLNLKNLELSAATYFTYRDEGRFFEDIGLWTTPAVSVTGTGEPERVQALVVTDGLLGVLRVAPQIGRGFTREDDSPRSPERVILAHGYWQRKFARDPSVIGRQIVVDGTPREIIGVLPAGFRFLDQQPQLVLPLRIDRTTIHIAGFNYQSIARLKPGATIAQANADIARMIPLVIERFPMPGGFTKKMFDEVKMGPNIRPLADDVIGDVGRVLWVLLGTVAHRAADRVRQRRQPLPRPRGGTPAGARRFMPPSAPAGGAWRGSCLSESLTLALAAAAPSASLLAYAGVRGLVSMAPAGPAAD